MHRSNRRRFLQQAAGLFLLAPSVVDGRIPRYKPRLSFTTLGCPDWTLDQIINFARDNHYTGLELRGILREMDLTRRPELRERRQQKTTLRRMRAAGLKFINLGSSATLHFPPGKKREENLEEGRRFIDLAHQLECPYVRVFPNNFIAGQEKMLTIGLIKEGLRVLAEYARGSGVRVLMETHGDLVWKEDLRMIMHDIHDLGTGLIWDPCNMWTVTRESPADVFAILKPYFYHIHVKDARIVGGKPQYCLLGDGEVPIFEAVDLLASSGYKGSFSFEWEKLWHPELAGPELAFPDYPVKMLKHFGVN